MKVPVLITSAGICASALGQTYEAGGASIVFEVWDGVVWNRQISVLPGSRVEWRTRVEYAGARTDLNGLGEVWWQTQFFNTDNSGSGASADQISVGEGVASGNNLLPSNMVPATDGANGGSLGVYGRVAPFGRIDTTVGASTIATVFRHSAGENGAPPGEWMRVAGSRSSTWALDMASTSTGTTTANAVLLVSGIISSQDSQATAPTQHDEGLNPVIFRGSFTASDDPNPRTVSFGTDERFFRRVGINTSNDNRRYISWQTSAGDTGLGTAGHRTFSNVILNADITIIPTPAPVIMMGLGGLVAARRRRASSRRDTPLRSGLL